MFSVPEFQYGSGGNLFSRSNSNFIQVYFISYLIYSFGGLFSCIYILSKTRWIYQPRCLLYMLCSQYCILKKFDTWLQCQLQWTYKLSSSPARVLWRLLTENGGTCAKPRTWSCLMVILAVWANACLLCKDPLWERGSSPPASHEDRFNCKEDPFSEKIGYSISNTHTWAHLTAM